MKSKKQEQDPILKIYSGDYQPITTSGYYSNLSRRLPFNRQRVPEMLRHPHIQLGVKLIHGRIMAKTKIFVDEPNATLKQFIANQLERFWLYSASQLLSAIEWGYAGAEVIYERRDGLFQFDRIFKFDPRDIRPVTKEGQKVGMQVRRLASQNVGETYLGGPKSIWHVHGRDYHPWFGQSNLLGAWEPYYESVKDGGARDIRALYYFKYAFSGTAMYYPPGSTSSNDPANPLRTNQSIAREIVEKMRTGGVAALPNTRDAQGNRLWELAEANPGPGSTDVREYNDDLKVEMLEGMGVPREVVEAAETGSGYSGRAIPAESFDSTLAEKPQWLLHDFDTQVIHPLLRINFGISKPSHKITTFGLARNEQQDQQPDTSNDTYAKSQEANRP